ncbi:hypothetical protein ACFQGT_00390 [Natrialbaceae archaeon GCM10025810]
MSQSQPHLEQQRAAATAESPYRRDSWWGDNETDADERVGHDPQPFDYRSERAAYVSHAYHRDHARKLCPVTLFATPDNELPILFDWLEKGYSEREHNPHALHTHNHEVELTEPELHVPNDAPEWVGVSEYGQKRHRSRYNEQFGHVTGPYLADLPADEFMAEVDDLLAFWQGVYDLSEKDCTTLRNRAKRMKHQGDHRDVDILESIVLEISTGGAISE